MVPLGHTGVSGAKAAAPLEFWDDQVYELFYGTGAVNWREHESVASNLIEKRFELIGDAGRCSYELRKSHALAMALGTMEDRSVPGKLSVW